MGFSSPNPKASISPRFQCVPPRESVSKMTLRRESSSAARFVTEELELVGLGGCELMEGRDRLLLDHLGK